MWSGAVCGDGDGYICTDWYYPGILSMNNAMLWAHQDMHSPGAPPAGSPDHPCVLASPLGSRGICRRAGLFQPMPWARPPHGLSVQAVLQLGRYPRPWERCPQSIVPEARRPTNPPTAVLGLGPKWCWREGFPRLIGAAYLLRIPPVAVILVAAGLR